MRHTCEDEDGRGCSVELDGLVNEELGEEVSVDNEVGPDDEVVQPVDLQLPYNQDHADSGNQGCQAERLTSGQ